MGRKAPLCAAALLLAACTVPLGYIDSYTLVLGLGAVSGLATGAGSGSLNALIADMSEPGHAARDMNWLFTFPLIALALMLVFRVPLFCEPFCQHASAMLLLSFVQFIALAAVW